MTNNKNTGTVALVSGGVDSMVMLHLLHSQEVEVVVLHINYQKRGLESDGDQECVEAFCQNHNIPCRALRVAFDGLGNFQEWARNIRYKEARKYASDLGYSQLATAHHRGDVEETFVMNLLRGTGLEGLVPFKETQGMIRPLLQWRKEEILAYAEKNHVPWREDASNSENDFTRNRIRNQLLPLMRDIDPRFSKSFESTYQNLKKAQEELADEHQSWLDEHLVVSPEREQIKLEALKSHPEKIRLLAQRWGVPEDFIAKRIQAKTYSTERLGEVELQNANPWLVKRVFFADELCVEEGSQDVSFEGTVLQFFNAPPDQPIELSANQGVFDGSAIEFPLVLRRWKAGDYFYPSGFGKKKTVSQFLTDQKHPPEQRREVLVLTSNDEVIWVVGMRQDQRFLLGSQSKMGYIARVF